MTNANSIADIEFENSLLNYNDEEFFVFIFFLPFLERAHGHEDGRITDEFRDIHGYGQDACPL